MNHRAIGIFLCTFISASCPVYAQYAGQLPAAEPVLGHESAKLGSAAPKTREGSKKATDAPELAAKTNNRSGSAGKKQSEQMKVFEPNSGKLASLDRFGATVNKKNAKPGELAVQMPMPKGAKKGHYLNSGSMSGMPVWVEDP